eukprot:70568_1
MWYLVILLFWSTKVSGKCKHIRRESKTYELDKCSYSSTFPGEEISWGYYCQNLTSAVFKQWDSIDCPQDATPTFEFVWDCNGDEDCDCDGFGSEDSCFIAKLRIENCDSDWYQETTYAINICQATGEETSRAIVCDRGDNLVTMSYENNECENYGFRINDDRFDLRIDTNSTEICSQITCTSAASYLVWIGTLATVVASMML